MWDFVGLRGTQATDVPRWTELQAAPYFGPSGQELERRLKVYHQLPKSSAAHLEERCALLDDLTHHLRVQSPPELLDNWWSWLLARASGKAAFLRALLQIHSEGWMEEDRLAAWHCPAADTVAHALTLTRHRYAGPDQASFWGDYWMKTLDPCHRYLPELHRLWESGSRNIPYILWLEDFSSTEHHNWFRYFSDKELAETAAHFENERLCRATGRPLHCAERQHFPFIITLEETLHVARAEPHLCHASFTRGRPVLASGQLQAREGLIMHLKFASGHYLSGPKDWTRAMNLLQEMGMATHSRLRITVFDRFRYVSRIQD